MKKLLLALVLLGAVMLMTGCIPERPTIRVDCVNMPADTQLDLLVRPSEEDYEDFEPDPGYYKANWEIRRYNDNGWVSADFHLKSASVTCHEEPAGDSTVCTEMRFFYRYPGSHRTQVFAQQLGSIKLAVVNKSGEILSISGEIPLNAPKKFAVLSCGTFDYTTGTFTPVYGTPKTWQGQTPGEWLFDIYLVKLMFGAVIIIMLIVDSGSERRTAGVKIAFWILSAPTILFSLLFLAWIAPISPICLDGSTEGFLTGLAGLVLLNGIWLVLLYDFYSGHFKLKAWKKAREKGGL